MAKLTVNIGTSANDRTGDNLRTAFNKINTNFTELYDDVSNLTTRLGVVETGGTVSLTTDTKGSVFADDSTLLVDGVNGKITGEVTGTISSTNWMASSDSYLTIANGGATGPGPIQIVASANLDLTAGAGQTINANRNIVAAEGVTGNVTGDLTGSVFGDDSTLLVDGVSGTIPAANLTGALPAIDGSALTGLAAGLANVVDDTTPQLGGDLQTNDKNIYFGDSQDQDWGPGNADNTLMFGSTGDLRIWVPLYGSIAYMQTFNSHALRLRGDNGIQFQIGGGYELLTLNTNGSVDIKYNGNTRMASVTTGVNMTAGAFKLYNYADATARDAALTSPEAGMMVYITDTNKAQVYNGTSWIDLH